MLRAGPPLIEQKARPLLRNLPALIDIIAMTIGGHDNPQINIRIGVGATGRERAAQKYPHDSRLSREKPHGSFKKPALRGDQRSFIQADFLLLARIVLDHGPGEGALLFLAGLVEHICDALIQRLAADPIGPCGPQYAIVARRIAGPNHGPAGTDAILLRCVPESGRCGRRAGFGPDFPPLFSLSVAIFRKRVCWRPGTRSSRQPMGTRGGPSASRRPLLQHSGEHTSVPERIFRQHAADSHRPADAGSAQKNPGSAGPCMAAFLSPFDRYRPATPQRVVDRAVGGEMVDTRFPRIFADGGCERHHEPDIFIARRVIGVTLEAG